jgi:hypothetical protein
MINKSLVDKLLKASQKIHQSSLRGSGNYITVNSTIASMISKLKSERRIDKIKRLFNV